MTLNFKICIVWKLTTAALLCIYSNSLNACRLVPLEGTALLFSACPIIQVFTWAWRLCHSRTFQSGCQSAACMARFQRLLMPAVACFSHCTSYLLSGLHHNSSVLPHTHLPIPFSRFLSRKYIYACVCVCEREKESEKQRVCGWMYKWLSGGYTKKL